MVSRMSSVREHAGVVAVAVLAFLVRLVPVLRGAGLRGLLGYDDGVYFAGAAALVSGRMPYRDFVLLHPPGILLALAPFAALARVTTDPTALAVARVVFMAVGALNAALVLVVARRFGRLAGPLAGVLYAFWYGAVYAEHSTMLEPLAGAAVLVALAVLVQPRRTPGTPALLLAGIALGVAADTKVWYAATAVILILGELALRRWRAALLVAVGALTSSVVIWLPFALTAPRQALHLVFLDQLGRTRAASTPWARLAKTVSASTTGSVRHDAVLAVGALMVVGVMAAAVRHSALRVVAVVVAADIALILGAPVFFRHYAALVAGPLLILMGVGLDDLVHLRVRRRRAPAPGRTGELRWARAAAAWALVAGVLAATYDPAAFGRPFPTATLAPAVAGVPCVTADEPATLAVLDVLTSDLRHGCALPVDLTGQTYGADAVRTANGHHVARARNPRWQLALSEYLMSGQRLVLTRGRGTGIGHALAHVIARSPVVASARGIRVRATHSGPTGPP